MNSQKTAPGPLPAELLLLMKRFGKAFRRKKKPLPLAVGIRSEIRAIIPADEMSDTRLGIALATYCKRPKYLQACLAEGARRIHLDGSDAGEVSEEGKRAARASLDAIEAQKLAKQQEAEQKAKPPVKKAKKPQPAKQPAPAPVKPRKEKAVPVVQVKKRRVLEKP